MSRKAGILGLFVGKNNKRKTSTKPAPPAKYDPLDIFHFSSPEEGIESLQHLCREFYAGNIQDGKTRTICFLAQTALGYLRAAIEAKQLQVQIEQLELDKKTHEIINNLLEGRRE